MCGICGIFEYERWNDVPGEIVHRMNETMVHRGPNDGGIFVGPGIGLGHRRLSIIDVEGGHQPMSNEDGTVWVLLNGEIYNYAELRAELIQLGHKFCTKSDTEAIVHLYEEYGEACFAKLHGMFSIAMWDSRNRKLVLVRDRVGKKPLFYTANAERIVFGSELKALLTNESVSREIDEQALSDYFSFGYIPAPKTIYKSIRKVMPGHYLVATESGLRETCYWDLSYANVERHSESEWCERLRHQLCEATRVRLMSEVPLGAFLSGGIDSSSVVAMMSHLMKREVVTCSISFNEKKYDEARYARQVSKLFATNHHEEAVEPNALEIVDKLAWHYDEPFADSSAIPTYYVSKIARRHVTVALGGDGGDESFAGYRRYKLDHYENRLRGRVPASLRRAVFAPLGRCYPALAWAPRVFRAKATFQSLARSPLEGYFNSISYFRPDEKMALFTPEFRQRLADYNSIDVIRHYYDRADTDDLLSKIQYVDLKTYLTDDILTKVDRASMAVSLEVRAPFLDHRLLECAASIPSSLKLRGGTGKFILKKALEPQLPNDILYRPKQGFAIPLGLWFKRDLKEMAREIILGQRDGILDHRFLEKIWDQHQKGQHDRSALLWCTLMFRKWHQLFARQGTL
jgi:asparagine synthase (glutamine-hydrolysing)